jgi:hypothetical protein
MGLTAYIYKSGLGDCSNGGISSRADKVTLVNVEGPFEPTEDRPAAMLVPGNTAGTVKVVAAVAGDDGTYAPVKQNGDGKQVGPMMGGAYVATSDSRFSRAVEDLLGHRFYGAVPLHDRFESAAEYESMSR